MTDPPWTHRLRTTLRDLIELNELRHRREQEIEKESEERAQKLRHAEEIEGPSIVREYEEQRSALEKEYQERLGAIEEAYPKRRQRILETAESVREQITESLDEQLDRYEKKFQEATFIAESVYEANENLPQEEYDRVARLVENQRGEAESLESRARDVLRQYGVKANHIKPSGPRSINESTAVRTIHDEAMDQARALVERLSKLRLGRLMATPLFWMVAIIALAGTLGVTGWRLQWQMGSALLIPPGAAVVILALVYIGLRMLVRRQSLGLFVPLLEQLELARLARQRWLEEADRARADHLAQLRTRRDEDVAQAREKYEPLITSIKQRKKRRIKRLETQLQDHLSRLDHRYGQVRRAAKKKYDRLIAELDEQHKERYGHWQRELARNRAEHEAANETEIASLRSLWSKRFTPLDETLRDMTRESDRLFPLWSPTVDPVWEEWMPPANMPPAIRFGEMTVDLSQLPGGLPKLIHNHSVETGDSDTADEHQYRWSMPLSLEFPSRGNLLIETEGEGRNDSLGVLQQAMFRLLTAIPPGKVRFTIIDPVGLGQNFAGFMHLADYNGAFVSDRIWTDTRHIEQRLSDLTEHMENVIQKYLRNEYETIDEYNKEAGEVAEPYRFLVIADLPANFSETAAKRLASILNSGARCGVHVLMTADVRQKMPPGLDLDAMRDQCFRLVRRDGRFALEDRDFGDLPLQLDPPPSERFLTEKLHIIGREAVERSRVEVPFEVVAPGDDAVWSMHCDEELRVPIGKAGATKLQSISLGRGTSQHVLIAGKTGSGKSTLLHALVTSTALWYGPSEVEFYLVDFKKGVEFKTYSRNALPHARVVAIESDREFGLSVLNRLDGELKRRGSMFREFGVQDLAAYRRIADSNFRGRPAPNSHAPGLEPLPRVLLIIDEFQEFFTEDDKLAQEASLLLDRLVRQGRAFGIHVLLGSQTLGGAYTLARTTIGQMAVRIALQCSETDSYLILSEDNAAARLLSRPGEAIYNDASGRLEGNSPFQIVWLPESVREKQLARAAEAARQEEVQSFLRSREPMIVFEGNIPADFSENQEMQRVFEAPGTLPYGSPQVWVGEAIAIKGPTRVPVRRQSGSNMLIVGQQDEFALSTAAGGVLALTAQHGPGGALCYVLDGTPGDDPQHGFLPSVVDQLPDSVRLASWRDVESTIAEIAEELNRRQDGNITDAPAIYLFVHGLHRFRMLRRSEHDFGFSMDDGESKPAPDRQFASILRDGPPFGVVSVVWCDTVNNLLRTFERSMLREFEHRVVYQVSATDSADLIDSPAASRLGMKRGLYYSEEEGTIEKFRPYGLPTDEWISAMSRMMRRVAAE